MERPDYEQRLEIVQEVIDRLLYLPENELKKFIKNMETLEKKYPLNYKKIHGVRIYTKLS